MPLQFDRQKKKYDGELKTRYTPLGREYQLPNTKRWVPSVTTLIGCMLDTPELDEWRARLGQEEADKYTNLKARIGETFHNHCEDLIRYVYMCEDGTSGIDKKLHKDYMKDIKGKNPVQWEMMHRMLPFLDVLDSQDLTPSGFDTVEEVVWSEKLGLAGRMDAMCHLRIKNVGEHGPLKESQYEYCVVDFKSYTKHKTKKELYRYALQMTAYAVMVSETFDMPIPSKALVMSPCMSDVAPQFTFFNVGAYLEPLNRIVQSYQRKYANDFQETNLNLSRLCDNDAWSCGVYL